MTTYILYTAVIVLYGLSFMKDKRKTRKALKISIGSIKKLMPSIIAMLLFIGISLSLLDQNTISKLIGESSGFFGVIASLIVGSVAFMPGFVAFPLAKSLLGSGAGYTQIAAFVSSLMAVGVVSLGLEMKYFGKKTVILRNIAALLASIVFTILVWRFI